MKLNIFIIAVLAGLLITSCDQGPRDPYGGLAFIGGIEGLSMAFQEGAPPEEIFDAGQHPFTVTLIIENVGKEDVLLKDFAEVSLLGISARQFGTTDSALRRPLLETGQSLRGAAKLVDGTGVPGDITAVSFGTLNYQPDLVGTQEILVRAELCYDYRTRSTTQICIKDNILDSLRSDKICSINEQKFPQNSGGPVHVSQVKQTPSGRDRMQISFMLEHVGTGMLFKKNSPRHCDDALTNMDANWVWVDVWLSAESSDIQVECPLFYGGTSGFVQLFQGAPRQISCTLKPTGPVSNRVYQDILHINMEYTYLQFVEKPIIIRDVSTGY